jgi:hypothetical protein
MKQEIFILQHTQKPVSSQTLTHVKFSNTQEVDSFD